MATTCLNVFRWEGNEKASKRWRSSSPGMKIWLKQYTWQAASSINQQIGFSLWTWIERCPYFLGGQFIRASRDSSKIRRQETTFGKQQHSVPYPLKYRLLVTRLNIDMLVSKQHGSTSLGVNDGNEPIFWCLWWIYLWKVIGGKW